MKIFKEIPSIKESVITIGSFDGLHLGHQYLIKECQRLAEEIKCPFYLITFEPHPRLVLKNPTDFKLLQTWEEKIESLKNLQVENLISLPFNVELSQKSAEYFVMEYILKPLNPRIIVLGYDHKFGKDRQGSKETFLRLKHKLKLSYEVVELHEYMAQRSHISSSVIRKYILEGQIEKANKLLGHNYTLSGKIVEGKKLGSTLGYPTANILPSEPFKLIPSNGVYYTSVYIDGILFKSATNIGLNPTFEDIVTPKIETHILDFNENIYGKKVTLLFNNYLRSEQKFLNVGKLKEAIAKDIEKIKSI